MYRMSKFVVSCTGKELYYLYQQSSATNLCCQTIFTVHTVFLNSNILISGRKNKLILLINIFMEGLMHVHYRNCSSPLKKLTVKKKFFVGFHSYCALVIFI